MARVCIGAVKLGLLPKRLVAKVTLGTAMWALSPKRRGRAGGARPGILAAATDKVKRQERREARIVDKGEVSREKEAKLLAKTGEGRESLSGRHRRRLERMDRLERENRDPFTEHSAALTHVGILQNAHDEMRRPGADPAEVRKQYESALNLLYSDVQADGLDRAAVERNTRVIAGQLMERDPAQAAAFAELGHGQLTKSDPQTVRMPGETETAQLWTGDFDDKYKGTRKSEGAFTPREPMGLEEHRSAVARTIYGDLASAKSPAELATAADPPVRCRKPSSRRYAASGASPVSTPTSTACSAARSPTRLMNSSSALTCPTNPEPHRLLDCRLGPFALSPAHLSPARHVNTPSAARSASSSSESPSNSRIT